jgi:tRNA A-37 threonylcarbamoyl transferase component Bud32
VLTAAALQRRVGYFRHRRRRQFLRKVLRNCTAFASDKNWRYFRVYDRSMASAKMLEFLADPDASLRFPETHYLKQGNTCTLWLARVDGRRFVVKRYNIKGLAHRIGRAFRRTRAAVSWQNAHRLGMYGIATARPVALLEQRLGPLRGRAWYISEYVEGDDVLQQCTRPAPQLAAIQAAAQPVVDLLGQLAQCRISHGDMKGTNFIMAAGGPVLIDLDAMQEHVSGWLFRRAQRRDMQRFMRNWDSCPEVAETFNEMMQNRKLVSGS